MATLEQIQTKLKKLQTQADAMIAKNTQSAVEQIRELMTKHGLTIADIEVNARARREVKSLIGTKSVSKAKATSAAGVPKYVDPKTGATWTSHGRAPAWIAAAKDRSKFLATDAVDAAPPPSKKLIVRKSATVGSGTAHAGQPKGKQPAKYVDPKSGVTWSGRGLAPAWLASAKDRTKFLIGSVAVAEVAASTDVVGQKVRRKGAGVVKEGGAQQNVTAEKKATVKKTAAKKTAAKKAVVKPALKKAVAKKARASKATTVKSTRSAPIQA
jgi:DNA-binding protein H-NS